MTLASDIRDACLVLPQLDRQSRMGLIERILGQLEAYRTTALEDVPPDKRFWIDTLIASVKTSQDEIASMDTAELLDILVEFEKLIAVLDGISPSRVALPTFH
ncbi:hypothetical protein SB748_28410 [Rhizobium sp. SIMBA_035]